MGEIASRGQLRGSLLRAAAIAVPLVLLFGSLSGLLSNSGYGNGWFVLLAKPAIMPPGWTFAVIWPVLYVLLGLALALVWNARGAAGRRFGIGLFLVQILLNYAWSPLFFAAHQVTAAFWLITVLIVMVLATLLVFARIRPVAAALMTPYLLWLCFAAVLNWQIDRLNPDAETRNAASVEYSF